LICHKGMKTQEVKKLMEYHHKLSEKEELLAKEIVDCALNLTKKRLGFLINFNVEVIKNGLKRYIV